MGRRRLCQGDAVTPVNAGFGPIVAIFIGMLAMLTIAVTQVALQALPKPMDLRPRWLGGLLAEALTLGWFGAALALLLIALAAALYGMFVNGWGW